MIFLIAQELPETHRAAEMHVTCLQGFVRAQEMRQLKPSPPAGDGMGNLFGCRT